VNKLLKKVDRNIEEAAKEKFGFGVYKSESAKLLKNSGCLRFVEKKIKPKTCKLLVNSILPLANYCYIRVCKTATIEWE
jgi:hypothetical protein